MPRSVAFEHRIAAAVADPGVVDVSTTMTGQVPHFLVKMIEAGEQEKFDKDTAREPVPGHGICFDKVADLREAILGR